MGFFSDVFGCGGDARYTREERREHARYLREERRARQQEEREAKQAQIQERIRKKREEHEWRMEYTKRYHESQRERDAGRKRIRESELAVRRAEADLRRPF